LIQQEEMKLLMSFFAKSQDLQRQMRDSMLLAQLPQLAITPESVFGSYANGSSPYALILNSVPKAGTYLLLETVRCLGGFQDCGHHTYTESLRKLRSDGSFEAARHVPAVIWSAGLGPGMMAVSHTEYGAIIEQYFLSRRNLKMIFIIRDPRDLVISWVDFVFNSTSYAGMTRLNAYQQEQAKLHYLTDAERIASSIEGLLQSDIANYVAWINSPACLTLKFEDLFTAISAGGGEVTDRIADYLELPRKSGEDFQRTLGRGLTSSGRSTKVGIFMARMDERNLERIRRPDFQALVLNYGYDPS
jgi:Sulfotransferase domain